MRAGIRKKLSKTQSRKMLTYEMNIPTLSQASILANLPIIRKWLTDRDKKDRPVTTWCYTCAHYKVPLRPVISFSSSLCSRWHFCLLHIQDSTEASRFEDFVDELLHHCEPYAEPKPVLVLDNASFHHYLCIRLHPQTDTTHKFASNSYFHILFDVKLGSNLAMHLF